MVKRIIIEEVRPNELIIFHVTELLSKIFGVSIFRKEINACLTPQGYKLARDLIDFSAQHPEIEDILFVRYYSIVVRGQFHSRDLKEKLSVVIQRSLYGEKNAEIISLEDHLQAMFCKKEDQQVRVSQAEIIVRLARSDLERNFRCYYVASTSVPQKISGEKNELFDKDIDSLAKALLEIAGVVKIVVTPSLGRVLVIVYKAEAFRWEEIDSEVIKVLQREILITDGGKVVYI